MKCIICAKPLDYEPEYCCDGKECGCMGEPIDPPVCSVECYSAVMQNIGHPYDERRQKAGIKIHNAQASPAAKDTK